MTDYREGRGYSLLPHGQRHMRWRRLSWLQKRWGRKRFLLRRVLCAVLAAEAVVLILEHDGAKVLEQLIRKEAYTGQEEAGGNEKTGGGKREWGFSVDVKDGVMKFWRTEVNTGPAKPEGQE